MIWLIKGPVGDVRKVAHDGHKGPKEIGVQPEFLAWHTDPKFRGGGALFDFGCYGAHLMIWLMNASGHTRLQPSRGGSSPTYICVDAKL